MNLYIKTSFIVVIVSTAIGIVSPAYGANDTRTAQTMSELTYKRLQRANDLRSRGKLKEACGLFSKIANSGKSNGYERAMALHNRAHVYLSTDNYKKAADDLTVCIDAKVMPATLDQQIRYDLAQLSIHLNDTNKGIALLLQWMSLEEKVKPAAHILLASAYMKVDDKRESVLSIKRAIAISENPDVAWFRLLASLYYELADYQNAVKTVEKLIELLPKDEQLWEQLTALHLATNNEKEALAVSEAAYLGNVINSGTRLLWLSKFYLNQELPERAAALLQNEITKGRIAANVSNLKLLSDAWTEARNDKEAARALSAAAKVACDEETYTRLGKLYARQERWKDAIPAFEKAMNYSPNNKDGNSLLILGMAYARLGKKEKAMGLFKEAARNPEVSSIAKQWMESLLIQL